MDEYIKLKAKCVETAVFQCLMNAMNEPENENRWRRQADILEQKFKTDHGHHYTHFLGVKFYFT